MEWIETTGKTTEEALELALQQLGVEEHDAEYEVVNDAKTGLFGRIREEARVRARVRPTTPRAKEERRRRPRRSKSEGKSETRSGAAKAESGAPKAESKAARVDAGPATNGAATAEPESTSSAAPSAIAAADTSPRTNHNAKSSARSDNSSGNRKRSADKQKEEAMEVPLEDQGKAGEEFLSGLLETFGLKAEINSVVDAEDDSVEIQLSGDGLGLLIGPKGNTLTAIQDLTRTYIQRSTSASNGYVRVDVGSYRKKRAVALGNFAHKVAGDVVSSNKRIALEAMSAPDRKIVHDSLTDYEGVETVSEGEGSDRHVVIVPAAE